MLVRAIVAATMLGCFFGLVGPFGSYLNGDVAPRIAYWTLSMWSGTLIYGGALFVVRRLALRGAVIRWLVALALIVVATIPHAALTHVLATAFWPDLARRGPGAVLWYAQVMVIAVPLTLGYAAWIGILSAAANDESPMAPAPPSNGADPSNLLAMLPPHLGTDILCLEMEDHYVRVHTPRGSALLLMSMSHAVEQVGAITGLRTHRSWWVARTAVRRTESDSRTTQLHLVNGLVVPVARRMVSQLRAAGWFDQSG